MEKSREGDCVHKCIIQREIVQVCKQALCENRKHTPLTHSSLPQPTHIGGGDKTAT